MTESERSDQQWARVHLALAVEKIGSEWHSGQWSKGYRKACQASRVLDALGFRRGASDPGEWPEVREVAAAFLMKHRRDVARNW